MADIRGDRPIGGLPFFGDTPPFIYEPVIDAVPKVVACSPASSRKQGGTTVTITGYNFRNLSNGTAPTVTFGGVAATNVVVVSATSLTCTVPAATATGVVDIVVTINGQSGTGAGIFTYFESAIIKLTPNHGPIAGGTVVLIEGYNFLNGSLILFDGLPASNIEFIDSQHMVCTTPNHAQGFVDVDIIEPL